MSSQSESAPFATLGGKLRRWRTAQKESLAEVAGAVELAEDDLKKIELGIERPSEEILMLLINHFDISEDEALQLWEMAGYSHDDEDDDDADDLHRDAHNAAKTIVMAIAMDPRVMYSDSVNVTANDHGIILNFQQPGVPQMQPMPIARIGMSREHTRNLIRLLEDTLRNLDNPQPPKQLPPQVL